MARTKKSTGRRQRYKKILKKAKGYRGGRSKHFREAKQTVERGLKHAYRHRREKKREFRRLWITRINAAARDEGLSYSQLMGGLNKAGIKINRKMLADIAVRDPEAFRDIVERAKESL
ncbi:MAG: 50S ribosomal protein L20 [bacterium]